MTAARYHATSKALVAGLLLAAALWLAVRAGQDETPPTPPSTPPPASGTTDDSTPAAVTAPAAPARDTSPASAVPTPPSHGTIEVVLDPRDQAILGAQCTARDSTGVAASIRTPAPAAKGPFLIRMFVPTERWLVVTAELQTGGPTPGAVVFGPRLRLGPGEVRRIELCVEGPATSLRIVGPGPSLLPHLTAAITTLGNPPRRFEAPLRPDGSLLCHLPTEPVRAHVLLANGTMCPLQTDAGAFDLIDRGGTVMLHPLQPLVGLALGTPGLEQPAALAFDQLAPRELHRTCTLVTAAAASVAKVVHGWTTELGAFTAPIEALQRHDDVWHLDPHHITRQATLTIDLLPAATSTSPISLLAEALDGRHAQPLEREGDRCRGTLAPGGYRLVWQLRDQRGAIALEHLVLTPGAVASLRLQPPTAQRWTVRLLRTPSEQAQRLFLAIGATTSLGSANDGTFTIDLLESPQENTPVELFSSVLQCRFPARLSRIDAAALRAEIDSAVADALWSTLLAIPVASGPAFVRLLSPPDAANTTRAANLLESPVEVPLLPATERRGCTLERIDGCLQLIGWFRLAHGARELRVEPRGRWATLRIERPLVRAQVFATGDGDVTTEVFAVDRTGDFPLFVADGTRAFHVDLQPGGRVSMPADGPLLLR